MKKIILGLMLFIISISFSQNNENACARLKQSKLHYLSSANINSYVEINNNKHTEYFDEDGHYIKSNLTWISDCEYVATITELNIPGIPFEVGDKLNVKIVKIKNNIVYMICTFQGQPSEVQYEIIEFL